MFALVVRFQVRPERLAEFDELTRRTLAAIAIHEPGTTTYLPTRVDGDPAARVFLEVYVDEAAFVQHEGQPHVRRFLAEREPMLTSVRVERLRAVDG
jgi:quinol monooxygenase YgiN